jgi:hypothetical protein
MILSILRGNALLLDTNFSIRAILLTALGVVALPGLVGCDTSSRAARVMDYARRERPEVLQKVVEEKPWFVKTLLRELVPLSRCQGRKVDLALSGNLRHASALFAPIAKGSRFRMGR